MQVTYGKGFAVASKDQRIDWLQNKLDKLPQSNCPLREYFSDGMYMREITIPKGVAVIGAVHKIHNYAVVNKGKLRIVTSDGFKEVGAGDVVQILPNQRNCVYAMEDSVWTNFLPNPTNERCTERLVEMFTKSKASDLLGGATNKQLAANRLAELGA